MRVEDAHPAIVSKRDFQTETNEAGKASTYALLRER